MPAHVGGVCVSGGGGQVRPTRGVHSRREAQRPTTLLEGILPSLVGER